MANEADLKLIQIPEFPKTDTLVGSGPEYVVLTKSDGVTYGMLTEDFKAFLGTVQVQVPKALAPTDPAPTLSGVYYPTVTQNEGGTPIVYANAGGIEVNTADGGEDYGKQVQIIFDGTDWSKVGVPLPMQDISGLATKAEFATVEPVASMIIQSVNLLNKKNVVNGMLTLNSGNNNGSLNWVSIKMPLAQGTYTISGIQQALATNAARLFFFPDATSGAIQADTLMSDGTTNDVTFTMPVGATHIGLNIATQTNIGTTPTNNVFVNPLQIQAGVVAKPYQPYGTAALDGSRIINFDYDTSGQVSETNTDIPVVGAKVVNHTKPYFSLFELSKNILNKQDIEAGSFSPAGAKVGGVNWIRVEVPVKGNTTYTLSKVMSVGASNARVVNFTESGSFISAVMSVSGQTTITFTTPVNAGVIGINIANDIGIGNDPLDNVWANTAQLEEGGSATEYIEYGLTLPAEKVSGFSNLEIKPCYVSYDPQTQDMLFYVRRGITSNYTGYLVRRFTDMSPAIYMDLFRLTTSHEYEYIDGVMVQIASNVLTANESECVYKDLTNGTYDHTGGYHGNELVINWDLYIDGVIQDKGVELNLVPCNYAWYAQRSSMHQAPSGTLGSPIVDTEHTIQAFHSKKTVFGNSRYVSYNSLEWVVPITFYWYNVICCLGKYNASFAYSEYLETEELDEDATLFSLVNHKKFEFYNPTTNKAATIYGELDSEYINDRDSLNFLVSRATDVKDYIRTPNTLSQVGKVDKSTMTVIMR